MTVCGGCRTAHAADMPKQPGCVRDIGTGQVVCPGLGGSAIVVCIRAPLFLQYTS